MTAVSPLRAITRHADLLELCGGDPFVRWGLPDPLTGPVLAGRGAVAVERYGRHGRSLWVFPYAGGSDSVREILDSLRSPVAELRITGISVPQEYADELAKTFQLGPGGDWDWMWTTQTPPSDIPGEEHLLVLDDAADAAEIAALSAAHSPTAEGNPGTGSTVLWLGLRSSVSGEELGPTGELVAVGGMQTLESGAPHLAGIVTHSEHRGHGLGRAVTAGLTRHAVREHGVCTLGMYSANPPARALYYGLGFQTAHAWHSRRIEPGPS